MPKKILLLDVDEVLADFVGGALALHGWTKEQLSVVCPKGQWSIVEPMMLSQDEFWHPINLLGEQFWVELPRLPWTADVLQWACQQFEDRWWLVSKPPKNPAGWSGKVRWIKQLLGESFDRIVLTPHKHLLANPIAMLVDDSAQNVHEFVMAGGTGLLFPSERNCLWRQTDNPVGFLRRVV